MSKKNNPFKDLMEKEQVTKTEFAVLLNTRAATISEYLNGLRRDVGKKEMKTLTGLGIEAETFRQQYLSWREEQREQMLSKTNLKGGEDHE